MILLHDDARLWILDPTQRAALRIGTGVVACIFSRFNKSGWVASPANTKHGGQEERDLDPVIRIQSPVVLLNCDYASRLRSTRAQAAHQCPTSGLVLKM